MLPEKYYEACLTYNIVNYYMENTNKTVYPFSISQREEKKEGYDFGYDLLSNSFMIQFKRPIDLKTDNTYNWKIDTEQLETILASGLDHKIFYCLPAFKGYLEWYKALDQTYFVSPQKLYIYLKQKNRVSVNSKADILLSWMDVYYKIETSIGRKALALKKEESIKFTNKMIELMDDNSFIYTLKTRGEFFEI